MARKMRGMEFRVYNGSWDGEHWIDLTIRGGFYEIIPVLKPIINKHINALNNAHTSGDYDSMKYNAKIVYDALEASENLIQADNDIDRKIKDEKDEFVLKQEADDEI